MDYFHNLDELLNECVKKYENLNAFSYYHDSRKIAVTYKDFQKDVFKAALFLDANYSNENHIALAGQTTYDWVVMFFAIAISGRTVVLPNINLKADEFRAELESADTSFIFCDDAILPQMTGLRCENINSWTAAKEYTSYSSKIGNSQPMAIMFTSGTSSTPKPVLLSHENLAANSSCKSLGLTTNDTMLSVLPNYHVFSLVLNVISPIANGMCTCLHEDGLDYFSALKKNHITSSVIVPSMLKPLSMMLKSINCENKRESADKIFGENLKWVGIGAAYVDPYYVDLFEEYGIHLRAGYGLTETSSIVSMNNAVLYRPGSVGKLQEICEVKFDSDGEILIRGKNVMLGYYKMPKETKEAFEDGWLKTGDIGYMDSDGFLYVTGRKKNVIITSNGENVSPEQLESIICKYDGIERAKAYQQDDKICIDVVLAQSVGDSSRLDFLTKIKADFNESQPSWRKIFKINAVETICSNTKNISHSLL